MNVAKLRHVVAIDRCGSVTAAAEAANVTQSSVTKSLADIETEIGHALFFRRARGMTATEQGRHFLDRATRILSDLDQLIEDAQAERNQRDQVLRIGIAPSSLEGLLNRAVGSLIREHPDYRVQLRGTSVERGIQLLRQGDLDICVGPEDKFAAGVEFDVTPLGNLHAKLFVRKGHPLAAMDAPSEGDIRDYPIILPDLHGPYVERLLQLTPPEHGPPARQIHILEHFPMIAEIVSTTDAAGVISSGYARARRFRERFTALDFDLGEPMPLGAAARSGWHPTRPMAHFMATLRRHPPTGELLARPRPAIEAARSHRERVVNPVQISPAGRTE